MCEIIYVTFRSRSDLSLRGLYNAICLYMTQVSTVETTSRGHQEYTLHKHLINEVNRDWSGYSEDEKNNVRRLVAVITCFR